MCVQVQVIPKWMKHLSLATVGMTNACLFDVLCKAYYVLQNKNNAASIYLNTRFWCKTHDHELYSELYELEPKPIRYGFVECLEKEAQFFPFLILSQMFELVPKMIAMCIVVQSDGTFYNDQHIMAKIQIFKPCESI